MKKNGYIIPVIAALLLGFLLGAFVGRNYVKGDVLVMFEGSEEIGKINLNTATLDELKMIPGFGDTTVQRIIDYRVRKGRFRAVDDLMNISGITAEKLEQIRHMLVVE